jgi:hypothetical protein
VSRHDSDTLLAFCVHGVILRAVRVRDVFGSYWRLIAPGSAVIRLMRLRAIKVRAEETAR